MLRNVFLAAATVIILSGTIGLNIVDRAGVDLPDWMGVNQKRSELEGRNYNTFPELTPSSLYGGQFQSDFEEYVADLVPLRDALILGNASAQRMGIAQAASLHGFDLYPTFYGSDHIYSPSKNRLYQSSVKMTRGIETAYDNAVITLNNFASSTGDVPVYFMLAQRSSTLGIGELGELTSYPVSYDITQDLFLSKLSNVAVIDPMITSLEEYDLMYFKTDHHWSMDGAYRAYLTVMKAMGLENEVVSKGQARTYDVRFYGSLSRAGLMGGSCFDLIEDYEFPLPNIRVITNSKNEVEFPIGKKSYDKGEWSQKEFQNRYAEYFHKEYGAITIENLDIDEGESLMIVGDSYTNPLERLFASHFKKVHAFDQRHCNITLSEYIEKVGGVDRIVFLLCNEVVWKDTFNTMIK